jgi:hypothetical protein
MDRRRPQLRGTPPPPQRAVWLYRMARTLVRTATWMNGKIQPYSRCTKNPFYPEDQIALISSWLRSAAGTSTPLGAPQKQSPHPRRPKPMSRGMGAFAYALVDSQGECGCLGRVTRVVPGARYCHGVGSRRRLRLVHRYGAGSVGGVEVGISRIRCGQRH